jgi:uncharacterized membrane protein YccC
MTEIAELEKRIQAIEARNQRVEWGKEWEGSWFRKTLIIAFTFTSIGLYMWVIGIEKPWLNAVIPSLGFTLSTLTLPFFKQYWIKQQKK